MDESAERPSEGPGSTPAGERAAGRAPSSSGHQAARAPGGGRAFGLPLEKNAAACAAVVAELEVDEEIRLLNMWCAADAGLVINPDGVINQL